MQEIIIYIIGLACLINLWCLSEPTIYLRWILGFRIDSKFKVIRIVTQMLECAMCSGTWFALIIFYFKIGFEFETIIYASISAVLAEIIYKRI